MEHFLKEKTEKKKALCPGGRGGLVRIFEEKILARCSLHDNTWSGLYKLTCKARSKFFPQNRRLDLDKPRGGHVRSPPTFVRLFGCFSPVVGHVRLGELFIAVTLSSTVLLVSRGERVGV